MAITDTISEQALAVSKAKADYIVRFRVGQRVEHLVLMTSFIMLSITGLAQKFYTAGWAQWLIFNMGGIEYTRLVHRAFALVFVLSTVYHFSYVIYGLLVRHARPTMLPTIKDVRDIMGAFGYSLGFAKQEPQYGRFDYRQKFEYWGIIFGSLIIIVSGFLLAFPVWTTSILPGQFVAAAKEFHSNEAMLAVLTIVIWHLYDVILKPGTFPGDTTIFTGKISRERMEREHPLEYAEIMAREEGQKQQSNRITENNN